jgi:hypothetical protein
MALGPMYTAKTQYRKFETIFPEKEFRGHSPNSYIHVSVRDLYIPRIRLPILLQEIGGLIVEIYRSLTDTGMWKVGLRPWKYILEIHKSKFSLQCTYVLLIKLEGRGMLGWEYNCGTLDTVSSVYITEVYA